MTYGRRAAHGFFRVTARNFQTTKLAMRALGHSKETKAKMSMSMIGKRKSKEHRENMSKGHIGMKASDETKAKMSQTRKGRKFTAEHREKMSQAQERRKLEGRYPKWSDATRLKMQNRRTKGWHSRDQNMEIAV